MSDAKHDLKKGVDKAASAAKDFGSKAIDKTKEAATSAGNAMKYAGEKVKEAGK
jgi:hypothetical protein